MKKNTGDSYLLRGLLRDQAKLRSLAFQDYRAAAKYGESVAKSNMAASLNAGPVAEAGLEILREHAGEYNSADPGMPYEIRATLERSVAEERKAERELTSYGDRIVKAFHRLLESWLRSRQATACGEGRWRALGDAGEFDLTMTQGHVSVALGKNALVVQPVAPFNGFYVALKDTVVRLLFIVHDDIEAVAINGFTDIGNLEWLQFRRWAEENAAGVVPGDDTANGVIDQRQDNSVSAPPK